MTSKRHKRGPGRVVEASHTVPEGVLTATRDNVLAVGVRRTTLTDVARRAGVSRMTLYRLVPDVNTLVLEVMTRDFGALLGAAEAEAGRRRSGRARVVAATVEVVRRLPEEPLFRRVLDVDPDLLLPYLTERVGATQRLAVEHIQRMLAEGVADGSVRRADLKVLATTLVTVAVPFVISAKLLDEVGRDAALNELGRMVDGWLRP
jgi:AcrR family transcriptional regulator